jgi:hypothetical protein
MNEPTRYEDDGFGNLPLSDRLILGIHARWNDAKEWHDRDSLPVPSPLLVFRTRTALQSWKDGIPEVITKHPLPDPADLNAAIPISKWPIGNDGKPRPPWALVFAAYMVEKLTGQMFTALNSTVGWRIAFEALQEQVTVKRMLHGGARLLPIVDLQTRPFKLVKQNITRKRPHLEVVDWQMAGGGAPLPAAETTPQLNAPAPKTVKESLDAFAAPALQSHPVEAVANLTDNMPKAVSSEEFFDDDIPWK